MYRLCRFFLLLCGCGCRRRELANADINDFDALYSSAIYALGFVNEDLLNELAYHLRRKLLLFNRPADFLNQSGASLNCVAVKLTREPREPECVGVNLYGQLVYPNDSLKRSTINIPFPAPYDSSAALASLLYK